jgi:ABC-type lipoprotein export system ATPase subunit
MNMLKIKDITMGYAGKPVIHLDKLNIPEGGQCLVTGASGGGKTTLLYAIAGLLPLISGKIWINGIDITGLKEKEMDRFRGVNIGIIFQTLHLMPSLTVMQNLDLAAYCVNLPPQTAKAETILKRLDIYDKKDFLPKHLSQGQAQRVAIARSVLLSPKLIIADEPTSSLDDAACEAVVLLIKEVAQETNAALLIATHDSRVKAHFKRIIHFSKD